MELATTRAADGAITTATPGAPAMGSQYGGLFAALLRQKMAAQAASVPRGTSGRVASGPAPAPQYAPQMGSQNAEYSTKPEAPITRTVTDPFASPYQKIATGFDPGARVERLLPNGHWEFEDLRPHGGSGGIQGGGAESSLHASANLGGRGPADPLEAQRDDYEPLTGLPRRAPVAPAPQRAQGRR